MKEPSSEAASSERLWEDKPGENQEEEGPNLASFNLFLRKK